MTWLIIRTASHRETAVANAIEAMGYTAWVPLQTRYHAHKRKSGIRRIWQIPLLAQTLFAEVPALAHGSLQRVRGFEAIGRDGLSAVISIPEMQISQFRDEVDRENEKIRRAYIRATEGKRSKPIKVKMAAEFADLIKSALFGNGGQVALDDAA